MAEQKQETLDVIIAVGSTGSGKSTLIKSFCKSERIKVSASCKSCTKEAHLFKETDSGTGQVKRIWLDTMGAEDSERKQKDEDILNGVMQMLIGNRKNVQLRLKILWFVGQQCRETGPLQTQAHFIQHLGDGSGKNAWNSTVIVQKQGLLDPSTNIDDIQGALAASFDADAPSNGTTDAGGNSLGSVKCIGFTRVDCLRSNHPALEDYNDPEYPAHRKRKKGLLNEAEMIMEIEKLVNPLPFVPISVRIQKCRKCGEVGDARWVNLRCHAHSNRIHPGDIKRIHTSGTTYEHILGTEKGPHKGHVTAGHPGYIRSENVGRKYHERHYRAGSSYTESYGVFCPRCGDDIKSNRYKTTKGSIECGKCERKVGVGGISYRCGSESCCSFLRMFSSDLQRVLCAGCCNQKQRTINTSGKWPCCNKESSDATGCKQDTVEKWSCCKGSLFSSGCDRTWSCCGKSADSHSDGCGRNRYICCKQPSGSRGCKKIYKCCRQDANTTGCEQVYECCNGSMKSRGCSEECSYCHREIGKGPGCLQENVKHDMIAI